MKTGTGNSIDDIRGGIPQHALGTDVENLNYALGVGGDTGKIRAVENCVLQGACFKECLLRPLASAIVRSDQQIANDDLLRVTQCRDRDDGRETTAVLTD